MSQNLSEPLTQLMLSRRSIRAFLPTRIDQAILNNIFHVAGNAPSNCNTQPWKSYVLSGSSRDRMSETLHKTIGEGQYQLDYPYDAKYSGVYRQRQLDVGKLLYQALGVTREDDQGKRDAFVRNIDFFDAPHVAFIFMPDWGGVREAADVGMYAQNLMIALQAHGIASCPQTILGYNADVVRAQLNIDPQWKLLFGVSFGYEDTTRPENKICPSRADVYESTVFFD